MIPNSKMPHNGALEVAQPCKRFANALKKIVSFFP
jgi:hypothetical protein